MPDLRSEVSVATDGNRIFMLGGFARSIFGNRVSPFAVYAFDPGTNGWSHVTDLPEPVNHAGLVYLDGALYVVGGYRDVGRVGLTLFGFDAIGRVMIFDLASGTWHDGPPMPTPRGAMGVVLLDGRIHAIGGTRDDNVATAVHEVLDLRTGEWTRAADLPTPRDHPGAVTVRGEIIVMGGRNPVTFELTANEIWSPRTNTWRAAAPVPTGRSGVAAAVLGGFVYLFGGEVEAGQPGARAFATTERYDPATDRWATLPPMPTPRHGHGAATVGDFIYVISGGPTPGWSFSNVNERLYPQ